MTQDEFQQAVASGNTQVVQPDASPTDSTPEPDNSLNDYIAVLQLLRQLKQPVTTAPTLTPKSFIDQFQFYDDGSTQGLYVWLNKVWKFFQSGASGASKVHVHLSADQALAGPSTATKVNLDTEDFDTNNEFTNVNPFYAFYPSRDGYYQVNGMVRFDGGATGETCTGMLYKNGSEIQRVNTMPGGSVPTSCFLSDIVYLTHTDYLELWGACSNSARKFLSNGSQPGCYLSVSGPL